jgi:signal transduction histidine kinase
MAAIRRPVRSRPIRLFLIGMFAVPLVSLVALWAFSATVTVPDAIGDHNYNVSSVALTSPTVAAVLDQLSTEQQETYIWLLSGRQASKSALLATRATVSKLLPGVESALMILSSSSKPDLDALEADLRQIPSIRQSVDAGTMTATAAFQAYSDIIDAEFQTYYASAPNQGASLQAVAVGVLDAGLALEMVTREIALVDGALAVDRGQMSAADRGLFTSSAASRRFLMSQALSLLPDSLGTGRDAIVSSPAYQQFQELESQITASTDAAPLPVNATAWNTASGTLLHAMLQVTTADGAKLAARSGSASDDLLTEAVLAGGVGLAAVVVSIFLMLWFGRRVTGDLTKLHGSVREMSEERLPRVVAQLSRGDDVDVIAESPPPESSRIEEISQIAQSFSVVQEAAVAAAVEQARLRKGVNRVFLNISMRNQSLLHRQLSMLDSMERRASEPDALADLFRLDHLTTRMRRHAEGLIILSGSTPGRGWRDPVPVVDVLRAAVAEVEDYVRVDVVSESRDLVAGNAVNDVIHLIAELVENAAVFSPPNTRIEVRADRVGAGLVAEIEDRGLGLSWEELADINRRLASPPEFDPANSEQLGLFVVSRLAARHAIKVSLRQSVYGGTTAILLLPFGVVVREEDAGSLAGPADWRADAQLTGDARQLPGEAPPPGGASGPGPAPDEPLPHWFSAAGRHRQQAAATGRRAGPGAARRDEEQDTPAAPRPLAPPPWHYEQREPQEPDTPDAGLTAPGPSASEWPAPTAGQPLGPLGAADPWPDAFSRGTVTRGQAGQAGQHPVSQWPAPQDGRAAASQQPDAAAPGGTHLGMPVRVPQASLAPQLRPRSDDDKQAAGAPGPAIDERSPEATRTMMILMQQGWERGRVDDLDDPAGVPDNRTER